TSSSADADGAPRRARWHTLGGMADALGTLRRFLLLTGLYYAAEVLASLYLRTPEDVPLFWPSAGIGFALAVSWGLRWTVVVPFALLLLHLTVVRVPDAF